MEEDEIPSVNLIPCVKWVRQGVAKSIPDKVVLNESELATIIQRARDNLGDNLNNDDEADVEESTRNNLASSDDQYNFSNYDNEGNEPDALMNIGNLAIYESEESGPGPQLIEDGSDSEKDDDEIKANDNLILVGHVEGDASILEVYVYNEDEGSLYVHHDFLLPNFPLCIEWLNFDPTDTNPGNLCAIGTMEPIIEVWDLDILDCLESAYVLGQKKKKKKKFVPKEKLRKGHTDAVLGLAWNESYNHVLASCSVDKSVILWDLNTGKPNQDIRMFEEKVQAIQWHPFETHSLLTGCCDKKSRVFDCRENPLSNCLSWEHSGEIETVAWNSFEPFCFLTGTSDGFLSYVDCRKQTPLWSFKAHEQEVTGLYVSSKCPGLVTTASNDGFIHTWDLYSSDDPENQKCITVPTHVADKEGNVGAIQCLGTCPNNPFTIAVGGDKKSKNFNVLDLRNHPSISGRFAHRKLVEMSVENTE